MIPYVATFKRACALSRIYLPRFRISTAREIRYGVKSGNLAMCFLGFSSYRGDEYYQRSAELGVLASIFDLTSDRLKFDDSAVQRFEELVGDILSPELASHSLNVLIQKKCGNFGSDGLDRGAPAMRIIIQHLGADNFWPHDSDVLEAGMLCQIVDDIMDFEHDLARGELNFLQHENWTFYANRLLHWDYERHFCTSQYPLVLFETFKFAKRKAAKLLRQKSLRDHGNFQSVSNVSRSSNL